jgi:alpha-beta hydrolase superfamily lysophospholipase
MDLRGCGGSHAAHGTAGYHEERDLHVAADRLLRESGNATAILWGESLGGAVSLVSATLPGAEDRFEQVIAWSPFCDLADASDVANRDTPIGRSLLGKSYRWILRQRMGKDVHDFQEYLVYCASELGMSVDELLRHGSPLAHIADLRVPATILHAEDDDIVPVRNAERFAESGARNLSVKIVPRGAHLEFDREAPQWYRAVTAKMLGI